MARGRIADGLTNRESGITILGTVWCRCVLTHFLLSFHSCPDAPQIRG
jgi:hypothetical protein